MAVEALGVAFGAFVIGYSVWFAYQWGIKPDRDARRREAHHDMEEMHQGHWKTWPVQRKETHTMKTGRMGMYLIVLLIVGALMIYFLFLH